MEFTGRNSVFYFMAVAAYLGDTDLPLSSAVKIELIKMVTCFYVALCRGRILNTQSGKPGQSELSFLALRTKSGTQWCHKPVSKVNVYSWPLTCSSVLQYVPHLSGYFGNKLYYGFKGGHNVIVIGYFCLQSSVGTMHS